MAVTSLQATGSQLSSRWERLIDATRRNPSRTDAGLAAAFTVAMVLSCWGGYLLVTEQDRSAIRWWSTPLAVLAMPPIAVRRRYPEAQFFVTAAMCAVAAFGNLPDGIVALVWLWFGLYGLGCYGGKHRTAARAIVSTVMIGLVIYYDAFELAEEDQSIVARGPILAYSLAVISGYFLSAWLFGDTTRIRRQQAVDLALRASELEIERDRNAERAVTEERLRIARELHDVMAHHVTVIGIQANAAERVLERDPAKAKDALALISSESRETVEELQRLLGFLRPTGDEFGDGPAPPQPSLVNVQRLVNDAVTAGVKVRLVTSGDLEDLPGSVSLSGYRIVQEALTNIRKHAADAQTSVHVDANESGVHVRIHNGPTKGDSRVPFTTRGSGLGLVGMKERARLVGGELSYGPSADGGWLIDARLPLQAAPLP